MGELGTRSSEQVTESVQDGSLCTPRGAAVGDEADQRTIGEVIRAHAKHRPEQPAIIASGYVPLSYKELCKQIDDVRDRLRQAGFDRNARIAVALPNGPEAALAIVAIGCAAVAMPLDVRLAYAEVELRLGLLRPSAVLVLRSSNSAARSVAERQGLPIIETMVNEGSLGPELIVPQIGPAAPRDEPDPDAPAFIVQTSATTAEPKLIPRSHRSMLVHSERLQVWFELTSQDRCLCAVPVYYGHGLLVAVLAPLLSGGSIAFPSDATQVDVSEWFSALRPTWYTGGPTLHLSVLRNLKDCEDARTMHNLRFIVTGGAPLSKVIHQGLEETFGVPVVEHYGCTEAGIVATNRSPPAPFKAGTCGIPWPNTLIVISEDGRPLEPGEQGEILVRGPTVLSDYIHAPGLDREVFVDGCFRTGDIGKLDEEGYLTLCGRKKEMINRGGEKIGPAEVDVALMRHPDVAEAAAYAVPHRSLGEDVAAAVVLRPSAIVTPSELRKFLSHQLAWFKIPRRIVFLDRLPKAASGKVQRERLREIN
jgi:oxalate---CoA ligase